MTDGRADEADVARARAGDTAAFAALVRRHPLLQIARNAALDQLRRRRLIQFAPLDDGMDVADTAPGPEARYASRQRQALLEHALQQIAAEHREILLLREIENLSYNELAAVLGIAEGTVKSRLARARAALLEHFRPHAGVNND